MVACTGAPPRRRICVWKVRGFQGAGAGGGAPATVGRRTSPSSLALLPLLAQRASLVPASRPLSNSAEVPSTQVPSLPTYSQCRTSKLSRCSRSCLDFSQLTRPSPPGYCAGSSCTCSTMAVPHVGPGWCRDHWARCRQQLRSPPSAQPALGAAPPCTATPAAATLRCALRGKTAQRARRCTLTPHHQHHLQYPKQCPMQYQHSTCSLRT